MAHPPARRRKARGKIDHIGGVMPFTSKLIL